MIVFCHHWLRTYFYYFAVTYSSVLDHKVRLGVRALDHKVRVGLGNMVGFTIISYMAYKYTFAVKPIE